MSAKLSNNVEKAIGKCKKNEFLYGQTFVAQLAKRSSSERLTNV